MKAEPDGFHLEDKIVRHFENIDGRISNNQTIKQSRHKKKYNDPVKFKTDGNEIQELFKSDCAQDPIPSFSSFRIFFPLFLITQFLTSITDPYSLNFYQSRSESEFKPSVYRCICLSVLISHRRDSY